MDEDDRLVLLLSASLDLERLRDGGSEDGDLSGRLTVGSRPPRPGLADRAKRGHSISLTPLQVQVLP